MNLYLSGQNINFQRLCSALKFRDKYPEAYLTTSQPLSQLMTMYDELVTQLTQINGDGGFRSTMWLVVVIVKLTNLSSTK